jgi:putative copper resistance protein D
MPGIWELASITVKFALYFSIFTAAGTVFTGLIFKLNDVRKFTAVFASIGLFTTLLSFSLQGAALTGNLSGMTDINMLTLLWDIPASNAFKYRLVGLVILISGIVMGRYGLILSLLGGIIALWSFTRIGHVPNQKMLVLEISLLAHLLAAAFWIGILMPLHRLSLNKETIQQAADLGHNFGVIAAIIVPIMILIGVYMSYILLGSFTSLIGSEYGRTLLIKITLVAGLLAIAAANKLRFVSALKRGDGMALIHFNKSIKLEWAIFVLIFASTATLTSIFAIPS